MTTCILISGCSGGGKSTLLVELKRRGHETVEEPGRRVVAEELRSGGTALPWADMEAFARRALKMSLSDLQRAKKTDGVVFFDRGAVDAAVALAHAGGRSGMDILGTRRHYAKTVYLAPPWPEIFVGDAGRRHDISEAVSEYDRLVRAFPTLGYEVCLLPKTTVEERADFILNDL